MAVKTLLFLAFVAAIIAAGSCFPNGPVLDEMRACDCDPVGSADRNCNRVTGACNCKPLFGGRRCDVCQELTAYRADKECLSCDCNLEGSLGDQCEPTTGQCACKSGFSGRACDAAGAQ